MSRPPVGKREYPLPFTTPMVLAILAGAKTETRRILNPQPEFDFPVRYDGAGHEGSDPRRHWWERLDDNGNGTEHYIEFPRACPYGMKGDTLYVKETYGLVPVTAYGKSVRHRVNPANPAECAIYVAGFDRCWSAPKRSPRFMPRWASDIRLRNEGVEVQRVQDITAAQAVAEGVLHWAQAHYAPLDARLRAETGMGLAIPTNPLFLFKVLWTTIYGEDGPHSWNANPRVYRVQFKRLTDEEADNAPAA